jgi:hypothetical protein
MAVAGTALAVAGCGSGPPPRKLAAIESCLQSSRIGYSASHPSRAVPAKFRSVLETVVLFAPANPTVSQQIKGQVTIIRLYPSDDVAQRLFQNDRASAPELTYANVIVSLPLTPSPRTGTARQIEACAFGRRAQPQLAPLARGLLQHPNAGRTVFLQAGCLACHTLDGAGNNGPGPSLTGVGSRLSATTITQTLLHPTAPMPSYGGLPRAKLHALVAYLASLRSG